jgi:hypothetical protein
MSISVTLTGATKAELLAAAARILRPRCRRRVRSRDHFPWPWQRQWQATDDAKEKGGDDAPTGPTVEEIRELAGKIESDDDQDKAIAVISDAGAESISGLEKKSAKVRQSVYDAIKAIVEKAAAKGKRKALD